MRRARTNFAVDRTKIRECCEQSEVLTYVEYLPIFRPQQTSCSKSTGWTLSTFPRQISSVSSYRPGPTSPDGIFCSRAHGSRPLWSNSCCPSRCQIAFYRSTRPTPSATRTHKPYFIICVGKKLFIIIIIISAHDSHVVNQTKSVDPRLYVVAHDFRRPHRLRGHQTVERGGEQVYRVVH